MCMQSVGLSVCGCAQKACLRRGDRRNSSGREGVATNSTSSSLGASAKSKRNSRPETDRRRTDAASVLTANWVSVRVGTIGKRTCGGAIGPSTAGAPTPTAAASAAWEREIETKVKAGGGEAQDGRRGMHRAFGFELALRAYMQRSSRPDGGGRKDVVSASTSSSLGARDPKKSVARAGNG